MQTQKLTPAAQFTIIPVSVMIHTFEDQVS